MKLRFRADADLNHAIVLGVQRQANEVDFQTAESVPLEGLDDPLVLALAAEQNRVLVSHDQNPMDFHFRNFVKTVNSPG